MNLGKKFKLVTKALARVAITVDSASDDVKGDYTKVYDGVFESGFTYKGEPVSLLLTQGHIEFRLANWRNLAGVRVYLVISDYKHGKFIFRKKPVGSNGIIPEEISEGFNDIAKKFLASFDLKKLDSNINDLLKERGRKEFGLSEDSYYKNGYGLNESVSSEGDYPSIRIKASDLDASSLYCEDISNCKVPN